MDFEGEAIITWGRAGWRPLLLAVVHTAAAPDGPTTRVAVFQLTVRSRPHLRRVASADDAKWLAGARTREAHEPEHDLHLRARLGRVDAPGTVPRWLTGTASVPARVLPARLSVDVSGDHLWRSFAGRRRGIVCSTARRVPRLALSRLIRPAKTVATDPA